MTLDVSVIVPTYNRADLIVETLDSILGQIHVPVEVIVVDDGSTDHTEAVVRRFGSAVRYVRIENSGECRARNVGVSLSRAQWVAFCDSDDLWREDKLSKQVQLVESAPEIQYTFTNFRTVTDGHWSKAAKFDSAPQGYWNLPQRKLTSDAFVVETSMFERLLLHQPIFPSAVMMRREFFDAVGRWDEPLGRTPSVDLEFHLRCVSQPGIGVISAPVVGIRKHASNFSGNPLRTTIGEIAVLRYVLERQPGAKQYERQILDQIAIRSAIAAEGAFAGGDLENMRQLLVAVPYHRRSWKLHVKNFIAHCPNGVGEFLRSVGTDTSATPKQRLVR